MEIIIALTDGVEDFDRKTINSIDELDRLNRLASDATGKNLWWYIVGGK